MSALAQARPLPGFRIHPRPRPTELLLLAIVAATLLVGGASLGMTQQLRAATRSGGELVALDFLPPDVQGLLVYLAALFSALLVDHYLR